MKPISVTQGINPPGDGFDDKSVKNDKSHSKGKVEPKVLSLEYPPRNNAKPRGQALTASSAQTTNRTNRLHKFDKRSHTKRGTQFSTYSDKTMKQNDYLRGSKSGSSQILNTPPEYSVYKTGDSISSDSYSVNQSNHFSGMYFNQIKINLVNNLAGHESFLDRMFRLTFLNDFRQKVYSTMNRSVVFDENLVIEYIMELTKLIEMLYNVTAILQLKDAGNNTLSRLYRVKTDAGFASEVKHVQAALEGKPFPHKWNQFIHWMYQTYAYGPADNSTLVRNFYRGFGLTSMYDGKTPSKTMLTRKTLQDQITVVNNPKFAEVDSYLRLAMGWAFTEIPPADIKYDPDFTEYWVNSDVNVNLIGNIAVGKGSSTHEVKAHASTSNSNGFLNILRAYYTEFVVSTNEEGLIPVNKFGVVDYVPTEIIGTSSIAGYTLISSRMRYTLDSGNLISAVPCLLAGDSVGSGCSNNCFVITPQSGETYGIETTPAGFNLSTPISGLQMEEMYFSNLQKLWE